MNSIELQTLTLAEISIPTTSMPVMGLPMGTVKLTPYELLDSEGYMLLDSEGYGLLSKG